MVRFYITSILFDSILITSYLHKFVTNSFNLSKSYPNSKIYVVVNTALVYLLYFQAIT